MKQVFIMRHAKTEDAMTTEKSDYDRTLTERGRSDARLIAERYKKKIDTPKLIIASTAIRAASTATIVSGLFDYAVDTILWDESLYLCKPDRIEQTITALDDQYNHILIVAHNFGVTDYVNEKAVQFRIDNLPTAGIVGFELDIDHWIHNNSDTKGKLIYIDYPKMK